MGLFEHFYANYFTVGALIPTTFHFFLSYLFLSIRNKSKPTFHLGIAYLYLAFFNFGYFIAGGFNHPYAAFHRWITVGFILLHVTHMNMFMLQVHTEIRERTGRLFLAAQYAVSFAVSILFFVITLSAKKVFIASAHQYDFEADGLSRVIGILIIAYLALFIAVTIWKVRSIRSRERYLLILMGVSYLVASIVPSVANVLSRDGIIDRGTFQVLWDLFSLAGLYILVILYLNYTQDRAPIMAKIVSIILLTVLVILQGFSYYSFKENEQAYDTIHQACAELAITSPDRVGDASYILAFSVDDNSLAWQYRPRTMAVDYDFSICKKEYRDAMLDARTMTPSGLARTGAPNKRHYRVSGQGPGQYVSYLYADTVRNTVYEVGYSYASYRAYLHPSAMKFINALWVILFVIILGFNLFFRGVIIVPLQRLMNGLGEISRGNLGVHVPVKLGDEIGFVTSSFNQMADTIRRTKTSLDEYTSTLEQKVEERTRELARSEERYRNILEDIQDGYWEVDLQGTLTFYNGSMIRIMGYTEDALRNRNYGSFTDAKSASVIYKIFHQVYSTGLPSGVFEYPIMQKDGTVRFNEAIASLITDHEGKKIGFRGIIRDVTGRKKAEAALAESEGKYRMFVESATDGIFRNDITGNFLYVNPAGQKLLGYSSEELLRINYRDLVVDEYRDTVMGHYRTQFNEKMEETYIEFPIIRKDGMMLWLGQKTKLLRVAENTWEFHGISRDVNDRKKTEEARLELEEQKTRFFANISHEIRTPLTLMLSPIESVLQGDYGNRINRAFFDNLYRNGLRLLKLVNNLLDFSKIEAGRMKLRVREVDLVFFVRLYVSAVHSAAESKGLAIRFSADREQVPAYIDTDKMDKVIMNLFSNSLKFTENGGSISVSVRDDDRCCSIEFRDTGEGIPPRSIESIFDRFSQADTSATRKHEGTGIGLALVKELVEMHGGTIQVESRYVDDFPEDHGSVFTVTIPKGRDHFAAGDAVEFITGDDLDESVSDHDFHGMKEMHDLHPHTDARSRAHLHGGRKNTGDGKSPNAKPAPAVVAGDAPSVLIVDDNPDMRNFLSSLLQKHYRVHWAENGEAGLEMVKRVAPDLVITDVMMPVMDGHELTRRLKKESAYQHIPVIMLTAKAEMTNKLEGFEQGADDFLTKPFNSKELLARIKTLLKTREYENEIARRNEEIEKEMEVARLLQLRLLPERIEQLPGFESHVLYIPMDKVGGDFYDYSLREQFIDIFIADVSGHGLPGAFLAMMTKMSLESVAERESTGKTLFQVNDVICRSTVNSNFVTAFLCRIDTHARRIQYCSAGHQPPLIYRREDEGFLELRTRGNPLGWLKNPTIEEKELQLLAGDRIIFFTDGITECMSREHELYGDDRFMDFIKQNSGVSPADFCNNLLGNLREFSQSETFDDDLTLIVLDVL